MIAPLEIELNHVTIRRSFAVPVERVYRAWTDPKRMAHWFKPNERWLSSEVEMDVRVGGAIQIVMVHSDGDRVVIQGKFLEVVENERLSFSWNSNFEPDGTGDSRVTVEFVSTDIGTNFSSSRTTESCVRKRLPASLRVGKARWSTWRRTSPMTLI
jgi:uncharacterized protein YndB with AHSA1/START domain